MRNKVKTKNTEMRVIKWKRVWNDKREEKPKCTLEQLNQPHLHIVTLLQGGKLAFTRKVNRNYN